MSVVVYYHKEYILILTIITGTLSVFVATAYALRSIPGY
jgi:hypothetical protein